MDAVQRTLDYMSTFGSTIELANEIGATGVRGRRDHDPSECLVARYVRAVSGVPVKAFPISGIEEQVVTRTWAVPQVVARLIVQFDDGLFPELVDGEVTHYPWPV
ncbi:hypothetical protein ND486_11585 [Pseudonocardia sp. DR1-2]|uniref:hypothetical protein n=1 Tax=Pseudonocardia sp. DR1-2 TaxID=2951168 RepID=UPI0020449135|nr:hypothetical protein [Pseudonocardia sp. DR1-2]MCM3846831.1 hypothetical protein [Pseudonocardia sp. DR1-2]